MTTPQYRVRASLLLLAALVATSSFACAEQVYFSEINYHPKDGKPEFIEILNQSASAIDFANWRFADGVEYEFPDFAEGDPQRTFMCSFERILVSGVDETTLRAAYSIPAGVRVFGPWTGGLSNGGENIRLEDKNGVSVNSIDYRDSGRKWSVSADGAGHTLVLINPNGSGSDWRNWGASAEPDGTPGSGEPEQVSGDLSLSEVHFNAEGNVDWVEVSSSSSDPVSADGLSLSSSPDFVGAVSLSGDVPANGYASWDVSFPTDAGGEVTLYLIDSTSGIVLDAKRLTRDSAQEGFQLYPPQGEWYGGTGHTRNAANDPARNTDIIINEIMADPPSDERNGEYVELYNRGASPVDLSGWRFVDGISFEIPPGTSLDPGQFLVVAANKAYMESVYSGVNCVGDYGGRLSNQGELLRLEDSEGDLADEVDYRVGGDWPTLANGDGSSLELAHPHADNDLPTSWKDSDETSKSTFQNFSFTSTYSNLDVPGLDKELWMHLVGDAHIVLKNIQLKRDGSNILQNHTLIAPSGNSNGGWLAQGTHHASHFQGDEFHLISDGHGDNRVNRIELQVDELTGGELTYEFQARWVMGKPRLIVKTFEDSFVGSFRLEIPNDLGTPGAANSILATDPPTGLGQLQHSPAVPSTTDNVRISARVASSPAPTSMEIVYRQDSSGGNGTWQTTAMNDSGTGGDTSAGDGIWSGQITDQKSQARIVQFYVRSTAPGGVQSFLPARGEEWPAMYVVDDDVAEVDVTTYRYVYSAYDAGAWASGSNSNATYDYKFPHLSNSYKNMTLVVDESEVYYNCEVRPSGSPWHAGSRSSLNQRGKWRMPKDNRFRGQVQLSFDNTPAAEGTANIFNNKVPRQMLYLMGHETSENEFATVIMNAESPRNSVEIFEPKGNDFLKRNFGPDGSQGELFRADDVFFFNDNNNFNLIANRHWWYAGDDWPGPARYHSQWLLRSQEADYDYSALINMLDTVQSGSNYTQEEIDRLVNAQRICMVAAVRGYIGDWDSFTLNRPKNIFFYRPPSDGKFQFLFHDSDLAFQNTGQNFFNGGGEFSTWINKPYNRRIFRYYLAEVLDKWQAAGARMDAWFDCENSVSSTYDPNQSKYTDWDDGRLARAESELGANYTLALGVDTVPDTSDDSISITGDAGYRVWEVTIEGHPEASFSWTGETGWRIDGIVLKSGENTLNITGLAADGLPAFGGADHSEEITVIKTTNGAPVVDLDLDPESANVALSELLHLDASASYDPEGEALAFSWGQPTGLAGFSDLGATATAAFATPGLYDFSVTASDPEANETTIEREISVFAPLGFSTFGGVALDAFLETVDVEELDNYSPGPWYSLQTDPGKLTINVPAGMAYPLGLPQDLPSESINYVDYDSTWTYNDLNVDLGTEFAGVDYVDTTWESGQGLLGFDDFNSNLPEGGIRTAMTSPSFSDWREENMITYYLRTEFMFDRDPIGSRILIDAYVDDGARFFLNGQEIGRIRLPSGEIGWKTLAAESLSPEATAGDEAIDYNFIDIDGSGVLVGGRNVLAVDVHNVDPGYDDLVFGARVDIASRELVVGVPSLDETIHPRIKRDLPTETDWVLQTDLELTSIQFGKFITGLMVEVERTGLPYRYAFGYQDGEELAVAQIGPTGTAGTLFSMAYSAADNVTLRIRREGDVLFFDWQPDVQGVWETLFQFNLGEGATTLDGGVFAATEEPLGLRVSFDYLMLIDPNSTSEFAGDIVISEVMYKPLGGFLHEYIELYNAGTTPVDLNGFRFPEGSPVAEFTFGEVTLAPGAYLLVVSDESAFLAQYGEELEPLVAGAWTGSELSNSGEEIILLDADGMVVASFTYSDQAPWPTDPDNNGTSLVPIDPSAGNSSDGSQWRASTAVGGSPGVVDLEAGLFADWMAARGETDPLAVKEGEALSNLLTYGLGVDLASTFEEAMPIVGTTEFEGQIHLTLSHRRRLGDPSIGYDVELSRDAVAWADAAGDIVELAPPAAVGDGTELVHWRTEEPVSAAEFCVLRVKVTAP